MGMGNFTSQRAFLTFPFKGKARDGDGWQPHFGFGSNAGIRLPGFWRLSTLMSNKWKRTAKKCGSWAAVLPTAGPTRVKSGKGARLDLFLLSSLEALRKSIPPHHDRIATRSRRERPDNLHWQQYGRNTWLLTFHVQEGMRRHAVT